MKVKNTFLASSILSQGTTIDLATFLKGNVKSFKKLFIKIIKLN